MALDEAIGEEVMSRRSPATIRFYAWDHPTISLGNNQMIGSDIDVEACGEHQVRIVRRPTGGSAVLHMPSDLTYSVMVRDQDLSNELNELQGRLKISYHYFCNPIVGALQSPQIGLPAECPAESPNDIRVYGCKISGNAQVRLRWSGGQGHASGNVSGHPSKVELGLLQHGTILYEFDEPLLRRLVRDPKPGGIGWVRKWRDVSREDVYAVLVDHFTAGKEWVWGEPNIAELARAEQLVREKYGSWEWTAKQGHKIKGSCYDHVGRGE